MADSAPKLTRWFAFNVALLCVLAPWATYWFQRHLQLYFTEIVIVGGVFTLWAFARAVWSMFERATQFDAIGYSRRFLSAPDLTIVLVVSALALGALWFTTASIYVQYEGQPGEGEYTVQVVRKSDGSPLIDAVPINAGNPVVGRPVLWQRARTDFECRILRPARYRVLDCAIEPGESTRIKVPSSFTERAYHLLRLVPSGSLYRDLAPIDQTPLVRRDLELRLGSDVRVLDDLRREIVYTGAADNEMSIAMQHERPVMLEPQLYAHMLAKHNDEDSARLATSILTSRTRVWPTFYLAAGDVIELTVKVRAANGDTLEPAADVPFRYAITNDEVQTVWFPSD